MQGRHQTSGMARFFGNTIVASQWLQAPLYFGLIVAQGVYVYQFIAELYHLVHGLGGYEEKEIMLGVLGLIDVVMISNLLIMVIIGGYHTFVSRIHFQEQNPPDWLNHINASTMKVKLSMALIGISSIHLLRSFINLDNHEFTKDPHYMTNVILQMSIHALFILSALGLAIVAKMTETAHSGHHPHGGAEGHDAKLAEGATVEPGVAPAGPHQG